MPLLTFSMALVVDSDRSSEVAVDEDPHVVVALEGEGLAADVLEHGVDLGREVVDLTA
jgi:hypothetical protein